MMSDAYYCWLIELIGDGSVEMVYQKLLWKLYSTEFIYELEYDRNRAADGLFLRKLFMKKMSYDDNGFMSRPCTVLEMIVALARKAEDNIMHDPDYGDRTSLWFWTMLKNLGLDIYDDYYYDDSRVTQILNVFMHHLYMPNGTIGGMFPTKRCMKDMRKMDLWWQLNTFFEENYPITVW